MNALRLSRRGLFGGFAALLAAPAIVRVASIMPVKAEPLTLRGVPLIYDDIDRPNLFIVGRDAWGEYQRLIVGLT